MPDAGCAAEVVVECQGQLSAIFFFTRLSDVEKLEIGSLSLVYVLNHVLTYVVTCNMILRTMDVTSHLITLVLAVRRFRVLRYCRSRDCSISVRASQQV